MMSKAQINSISTEGQKLCNAILSDPGCWIYIDEQKEQHIAAQKTEKAKAKIKKMDRYEFLIEFLIKPEYRNEKTNALHCQKNPFVTDSDGWEVPIEDAIDRKDLTEQTSCSSRGYDTERVIEEFEGLDEIEKEIRENTTPRQRHILYASLVDGATNEMIAEELGTNAGAIAVQKSKLIKKLRTNEKLRLYFASLKGKPYGGTK